MQPIARFNIRVYGILMENGKILLVDEDYKDHDMTKYPGGGLLPGEGTIECLKREIKEELNIEVEVEKHFYTTDFFQRSAFNETDQVFSIYYFIKRMYPEQEINYNWIEQDTNHQIKFRWVKLEDFTPDMLTFPIDKKVAVMLLETYK